MTKYFVSIIGLPEARMLVEDQTYTEPYWRLWECPALNEKLLFYQNKLSHQIGRLPTGIRFHILNAPQLNNSCNIGSLTLALLIAGYEAEMHAKNRFSHVCITGDIQAVGGNLAYDVPVYLKGVADISQKYRLFKKAITETDYRKACFVCVVDENTEQKELTDLKQQAEQDRITIKTFQGCRDAQKGRDSIDLVRTWFFPVQPNQSGQLEQSSQSGQPIGPEKSFLKPFVFAICAVCVAAVLVIAGLLFLPDWENIANTPHRTLVWHQTEAITSVLEIKNLKAVTPFLFPVESGFVRYIDTDAFDREDGADNTNNTDNTALEFEYKPQNGYDYGGFGYTFEPLDIQDYSHIRFQVKGKTEEPQFFEFKLKDAAGIEQSTVITVSGNFRQTKKIALAAFPLLDTSCLENINFGFNVKLGQASFFLDGITLIAESDQKGELIKGSTIDLVQTTNLEEYANAWGVQVKGIADWKKRRQWYGTRDGSALNLHLLKPDNDQPGSYPVVEYSLNFTSASDYKSQPDIPDIKVKLSFSFRYSPQTSFNNQDTQSIIQAIEFILCKRQNGQEWCMACQWENVNSGLSFGKPNWRYWYEGGWYSTQTESLLDETWHTVMIKGMFKSQTVYYESLQVDQRNFIINNSSDITSTTAADGYEFSVHLDGNARGEPYNVVIDQVNLVLGKGD